MHAGISDNMPVSYQLFLCESVYVVIVIVLCAFRVLKIPITLDQAEVNFLILISSAQVSLLTFNIYTFSQSLDTWLFKKGFSFG